MTYLLHGNPTASLFIVADAPESHSVSTPLLTPVGEFIPVSLHRYGMTYAECTTTYLLSRPLPWDGSIDAYFTSVKKLGHENGWQAVSGGFASPELLQRRQELLALLDQRAPACVLVLGELALWAVTGETKLATKRGSIYPSVQLPSGRRLKVVCTLSPVDTQKQWDLRDAVQRDIARAVTEARKPGGYYEPKWNFKLQASFETYMFEFDKLLEKLSRGPLRLACDIETIRYEIACISFAWTPYDAFCLPLRTSKEYWTIDQEVALVQKMRKVLEHPNARICGQNFHYDSQYITLKWGIVPRVTDDTLLAQHLLFPGMPKALYFLASIYCEWYQYWKDDLKDYKQAPTNDNDFFAYNCRDSCYTLEAMEKLDVLLDRHEMRALYAERMGRLWWTILRMTIRGVRIDVNLRKKLNLELFDAGTQRQEFLNYVIGREFNPRSPTQMKDFFYTEMGVKPVKSRVTKKPSLNAEILQAMHETYPLLGPVADTIIEMRSIGTFRKTFIEASVDQDTRVRTFYSMGGTETFRLASSENAFGTGMNLQNIPSGSRSRTRLKMPNIREMFLPDWGYETFDIDLAGADAQVVAWEANDESLKELFRAGIKVHAVNAKDLFGGDAGPDGKREPYYTRTKAGVHLTNYGGYPPTLAKTLGITVHEAEKFQARWFDLHPGIKDWHNRIEAQIQETRTVTNKFGYRKIFFGRIDRVLPEALAWVPQSTVAIVTNKALDIIDLDFPLALLYMQVHDSIVYGLPIARPEGYSERLLEAVRITIPYDDPLIIPWGCKSSTQNWGMCG